MGATLVETLREIPGGPLSAAELEFCQQMRHLFRAALDGNIPFIDVPIFLYLDLLKLREKGFDFDAAVADGFQPSIATVTTSENARGPVTQLSPAERAFLEDVDGFVDFAVRNGLSFPSVLGIVTHDLAEMAAHEWSLEEPLKAGFLPKATGWAKRNIESMREPEELEGEAYGEQD